MATNENPQVLLPAPRESTVCLFYYPIWGQATWMSKQEVFTVTVFQFCRVFMNTFTTSLHALSSNIVIITLSFHRSFILWLRSHNIECLGSVGGRRCCKKNEVLKIAKDCCVTECVLWRSGEVYFYSSLSRLVSEAALGARKSSGSIPRQGKISLAFRLKMIIFLVDSFSDELFTLLKCQEKNSGRPEICLFVFWPTVQTLKSIQLYCAIKQKSSKVKKLEPVDVWLFFFD